jgi:hypothetical protein
LISRDRNSGLEPVSCLFFRNRDFFRTLLEMIVWHGDLHARSWLTVGYDEGRKPLPVNVLASQAQRNAAFYADRGKQKRKAEEPEGNPSFPWLHVVKVPVDWMPGLRRRAVWIAVPLRRPKIWIGGTALHFMLSKSSPSEISASRQSTARYR